jgi:hypothetical protein
MYEIILLKKSRRQHQQRQRPNCLQASATVALGKVAITSVILAISEAAVLWGALLTSLSQTLHIL